MGCNREHFPIFRPGFTFYRGIMGGGKTDYLINQLKKWGKAGFKVQAFKSVFEENEKDFLYSKKEDLKFPAISSPSVSDISSKLEPDVQVIGIENAQFWDKSLLDFVCSRNTDIRVLVTGIQLDFMARPFPLRALNSFDENSDRTVCDLMAYAEDTVLFRPGCNYRFPSGDICGETAYRMQRWEPNGRPSKISDPTIAVGSIVSSEEEKQEELAKNRHVYSVRCKKHFLGY